MRVSLTAGLVSAFFEYVGQRVVNAHDESIRDRTANRIVDFFIGISVLTEQR